MGDGGRKGKIGRKGEGKNERKKLRVVELGSWDGGSE